MSRLTDITDFDDVKIFVDSFYTKVQKDPLISDVFNTVIQDRWPAHLEKMYRFWQTVLLEKHTYYGSPFLPHAKLPIEKKHFDQWLKLFNETIDEQFAGEKAERTKWQGQRMAEMFLTKIEYYKDNPSTPLL